MQPDTVWSSLTYSSGDQISVRWHDLPNVTVGKWQSRDSKPGVRLFVISLSGLSVAVPPAGIQSSLPRSPLPFFFHYTFFSLQITTLSLWIQQKNEVQIGWVKSTCDMAVSVLQRTVTHNHSVSGAGTPSPRGHQGRSHPVNGPQRLLVTRTWGKWSLTKMCHPQEWGAKPFVKLQMAVNMCLHLGPTWPWALLSISLQAPGDSSGSWRQWGSRCTHLSPGQLS